MATVLLHPDSTAFPPGTVVKVYSRPEPETPGPYAGEPVGTKVGEDTVASAGTLEVTGLTEGTQYIGWSQRSGVDYYLRFRADTAAGGGGGSPTGAAGGDLEGTYPNPTLASAVVEPAELAASAVGSAALATGAVTATKIAAGAVETAAIATGAVTAAKIAAAAVETAKIAAGAVETAQLAALAVTGAKIAAKTIEKANLTTKAIEELSGTGGPPSGAAGGDLAGEYPNPTIGTGKVVAAKLGAEAVESAAIKALAVTAAKLAAESVEESKLTAAVIAKWATAQANAEAAAVPRLKVKATAVTAGQAAPYDELLRVDATASALTITLPASAGNVGRRVAVEKTDTSANEVLIEGEIRGTPATTIALRLQNEVAILVAGTTGGWYPEAKYVRIATLDARYIRAEAEAVTESELKALAVSAAKLAAEAVETAKIKAEAVTATKLASASVTAAKIAGEAVEAAAIAGGAVTATKLGAEAVETAKIKAGAVTSAKIATGAVVAAALGAEAVESAAIKAGAVNAAAIGSGAVTAAKLGAEAVETAALKAEAVTSAKRTKIVLEQKMRFAIAGAVEAIKYPGGFEPASGWSIIKAEYEILEGTSCELEVLKNAAAITGLTALKAEKSKGEKSQTQALTEGDKVDIKVTAITGAPKGLSVTLHMTKEV